MHADAGASVSTTAIVVRDAAVDVDAAPTTRRRSKHDRKSNSERGRDFRAKRKEYELSLLEMIRSLRDEVRDLDVLREIRSETVLSARNGPDGSVARLIRQYFELFARGRPTQLHVGGKRTSPRAALELIAQQDAFLQQVMDDTMQFGNIQGVGALVDQWERYTLYHSSFRTSVVSVDVMGSEDSPLVTVTSNLTVKLTRETFRHIFPHVANNEALVGRLVGKEITYRGVNHFQFGADDQRVLVYDSDVDFINAFISAGVSLADVTTLMGQALIADHHLLGEEPTNLPKTPPSSQEEAPRIVEMDPDEPKVEDTVELRVPKRPCQTIEYLLN